MGAEKVSSKRWLPGTPRLLSCSSARRDLTSAAGKLMLSMLAAVAEMKRDLLVERTQSDLAKAKAQGKTPGRPSTTTPERSAIVVMNIRREQG